MIYFKFKMTIFPYSSLKTNEKLARVRIPDLIRKQEYTDQMKLHFFCISRSNTALIYLMTNAYVFNVFLMAFFIKSEAATRGVL